MLQFHGGEAFVLAINNSSKRAYQVFSYVDGPKFYILDCLPEMQASVFEDSITALICIARYLTAKSKNEDLDVSHFYYEEYGGLTADLD